jgi:hypothetical protein
MVNNNGKNYVDSMSRIPERDIPSHATQKQIFPVLVFDRTDLETSAMRFRVLMAVVLTFGITFLSSSVAQTVSPAAAPSPMPPAPTLEESKPTEPTAPADATKGPYDNSEYLAKRKARMEKGGWNVRVDVQWWRCPRLARSNFSLTCNRMRPCVWRVRSSESRR